MDRKKRVLGALGLAACLAVIGGAWLLGSAPAQAAGGNGGQTKIEIAGSTTVAPIAEAFRDWYRMTKKPVTINISATGSGDGARALINGTTDIANMSRFMKEKEFKAAAEKGIMPVAHIVALDGIAIVVNPANPVEGLKLEQVKKMYLGEITNWKEVGGADQPVVLIGRESNSGTFDTVKSLVMSKEKCSPKMERLTSNGAVKQRVAKTPSAIGYVGLGFLDDKIKALAINGIVPSGATVKSGEYAVARPLFMFTDGYPKLGSPVQGFVTFYLTRTGQKIVKEIGFVPMTEY